MNWITRLFRNPVPQPTPEPEGDGPLYGLAPPEGCQFDVSLGSYGWWHVRIVQEGSKPYAESIAHGCANAGTHKASILEAARNALKELADKREVAEMEGLYPPKRIE